MAVRSRCGMCCILLGILLLAGAASLLIRNNVQARQAQNASNAILLALKTVLNQKIMETSVSVVDEPWEEEKTEDGEMTVCEVDGYGYIGYVSIPKLELELPVMAEWDYPRLKIAPCRYYGSTMTDNLVIAAHNYPQHFGKLSKLSKSDEVFLVDMDGVSSRYEVSEIDILDPAAVEEMTETDCDLTMFTCTYGGASRVTVRCEKVESDR